ncbi:PHP domain-containing protein [Marinobacter salinisoli]|uniref:PHP domain-containing protein n=1 Tax=Marinobacter salinisoli TaxID=2769486 RepID=A0ABX7MQ22_9GAMM|nr:PHP domain-containing protein [Marinobacter salinisoli]QSP93479.1 PHP domain-containing protein [Marinobacter salinisoli]
MTIPQDPQLCIDLHCHSTASDGALHPADLVERAAGRGVTHLALTDHDTIDGLEEAQAAASRLGVRLVPGVELSCIWKSRTIHIVGLDFDPSNELFLKAMETQKSNRWARARQIADRLSKLGVTDLLGCATEFSAGDVPGRPHFAQALVAAGVVSNQAQAFKRHLGAGKPGDVKAFWPELEEVVSWISAAGGIAVLAHPRKYQMTATKLRQLTGDFRRAGGRALEVSTSGQSSGDLGFLAELCRREGMLASQGSDFHFPGAPWCELGRIMKMPDGLEPVWHYFKAPVGVPEPV